VPPKQRLGLDQHQRLAPVREHRRQRDEKHTLRRAELRLLHSPSRHDELLAKQRVLGEELLFAAQEVDEQPAQRPGLADRGRQGLSQILPAGLRCLVRDVASLLEDAPEHVRIRP
jgi:hypothetical protein